MVMHKRGWFVVALILLVLPVASALTAQMEVKTPYEDHGVIIRVKSPVNGGVIDSVYSQTNGGGSATAQYETTREQLSFSVYIMKKGKVVETRDFGPLSTSSIMELSFINETKNETVESNVTSNDTLVAAPQEVPLAPVANTTTESAKTSAGVTGNAVEDSDSSSKSSIIFIIFLAVAIGGVAGYFLFMGFTLMHQIQARQQQVGAIYKAHSEQAKQGSPAINALRSMLPHFGSSTKAAPAPAAPKVETVTPITSEFDRQIEEANQKMKAAQQELINIKKKEELLQAQKRLAATQRELERAKAVTQREESQIQQKDAAKSSQDPLNKIQKL